MCDAIVIGKALGGNITIEYQRDASVRATEIVVVNTAPGGVEIGTTVVCYDDGGLTVGQPQGLTAGRNIHLGPHCQKECCNYMI